MAVQDINNPLASGELAKGSGIYKPKETGTTGNTSGRERIQRQQAVNQVNKDQNTVRATDTYEVNNTKFAAELTKMIETAEPEPREDVVNTARERVKSGYYNSGEYLTNLASKLINTGDIPG
ncbi:MAG: hypothetical protein JXB48_24500 [Candidatus Latescibacteria bacterium]|nr:hypothetical protein [Candidatus Latescibacterota bacterium]